MCVEQTGIVWQFFDPELPVAVVSHRYEGMDEGTAISQSFTDEMREGETVFEILVP